MRRLLALLLVVGLAFIVCAPAFAIDQETDARIKALEDRFGAFTFYGSVRFDTFYQSTDNDYVDDAFGYGLGLHPDNEVMQWQTAGNTRFGAKVQKGNLGGRAEFGMSSGNVSTRLIYGTYQSGDLTILFGHDWAPLGDWGVSNQVYFDDNDLAGFGVIDKSRTSQVKFRYKGLEAALVKPVTKDLGVDGPKVDALFPTLEARYQLYLVPDKIFVQPFFGINTYKVEVTEGNDESITPWTAGLNAGLNIKPVYVNAMGWYALDGVDMGLNIADAFGAYFDPVGDKVVDEKNTGFAVVVGCAIDKYTVEAGYGFVSNKWDSGPQGTDKDEAQSYYANVTIPLVGDNFFVVPEVGVLDFKNDARVADEGNGKATYWGAKWQLDF